MRGSSNLQQGRSCTSVTVGTNIAELATAHLHIVHAPQVLTGQALLVGLSNKAMALMTQLHAPCWLLSPFLCLCVKDSFVARVCV